MDDCRLNQSPRQRNHWVYEVERWVDGESSRPREVADHVAQCPSCRAYEARLRALRAGIAAVTRTDTIGDGQFPAFMQGIHHGRMRPSWRYLSWKTASVSFAALLMVVAGSLYTFEYRNVPDPPIVESASTDIEDGTVTTYASDDGVTTVWVVSQDNDVW